MYDVEKIYDEQINPLMSKIIEICKEYDIHMIASFALNDEDLVCTTYLKSVNHESEVLDDAAKVIQNGYIVQKPYFTAMTITTK